MIIFSLCRIRERKESVTVLLCGTSGCGKSTLSALLVFMLSTLILIVVIMVFSVSTDGSFVFYFIVLGWHITFKFVRNIETCAQI
jgi:pantothenate kinase-related protein Tda10